MPQLGSAARAYNASEIAIMSAAFEMAYVSVATDAGRVTDVSGALARAILRQVDQGEWDPARISELASEELRKNRAAGR